MGVQGRFFPQKAFYFNSLPPPQSSELVQYYWVLLVPFGSSSSFTSDSSSTFPFYYFILSLSLSLSFCPFCFDPSHSPFLSSYSLPPLSLTLSFLSITHIPPSFTPQSIPPLSTRYKSCVHNILVASSEIVLKNRSPVTISFVHVSSDTLSKGTLSRCNSDPYLTTFLSFGLPPFSHHIRAFPQLVSSAFQLRATATRHFLR